MSMQDQEYILEVDLRQMLEAKKNSAALEKSYFNGESFGRQTKKELSGACKGEIPHGIKIGCRSTGSHMTTASRISTLPRTTT
jgi:hypothetical protein